MTLGVLFSSGKGLNNLIRGFASTPTPSYTITLDSSNKVTTAGDVTQHTASGYGVVFTYGSVSSSTSGHVTLSSGGVLKNKDHIRSITSITANFSGSGALKFKVAYGGEAWGSETEMTSGYTYELDSNPYFVSFGAYNNTVTITSITITYSCLENPDAAGHQVDVPGESYYEKVTSAPAGTLSGEYLIVYESDSTAYIFDGSLSPLDAIDNYVEGTISNDQINGSDEINAATFTISPTTILSSSGLYIGQGSNSNGLTTSSSSLSNTISVTNGVLTVLSSGGAYLRFNDTSNQMRFRYFKSSTYTGQKAISLYAKVETQGGSHTEYDKPEDSIIGFGAVDTNASNYYNDDIYDNSNSGLSVWANKMGGTTVTLDKGGNDGYSYIIKNSANETIDTSQAFGSEGIYTLIVSYKNYIPVEIQLTVGFRLALTGIEVISTNTIFNTAQKLSDYTSGISVNLTYNKSSENEEGVPYSSFASKGLSLTLINPSEVNYSITSLFGTAGTWKIKVASTSNASIFGTVNITVNAIPVTGISVTGAEATVEEESQLQLTAAVTPNNATIQTVTWSSNHESIATVNTNGLVTGVSAGEARITATATDGSAVYGYIDITVTAKPIQTQFDAEMAPGTNALACTVDGVEGVKVATGKASGDMTITVGAGATRLSFYAAGWNGATTVIGLSGATFGTDSFTLTADSGIAGSSLEFTLSGNEENYYCETTLSGITSDTEITVSASTRFALWKAKYYTAQVDPVYPTSISLEAGATSVAIGGTTSLSVNYTPADTNVKNVTFSSNATAVATVSSEGVVTGVAAGSARITATAEAENSGTVSAYIDITVTAIAVSGVSVTPTSASIAVDDTQQLTATISPYNATNQNVTWTSSHTNIATVSSSGLVTGKEAGTTTITVTSVADSTKKATCTITVTASGGSSSGSADVIDNSVTSSTLSSTATSSWHSDFTVNLTTADYYIHSMGTKGGTHALQWNGNGYLYSKNNSDGQTISSVEIVATSGKTLNIYLSNTAWTSNSGTGSEQGSVTGTGTFTPSGSYKYLLIKGSASSTQVTSITINYGTPPAVDPTSISIEPSSLELYAGGSRNLAVNYTPSNANQNTAITWSRYSGSSNISVDSSGKVTVANNTSAGTTAVIRAKLTNITSIYADCTVTVVEQSNDDQTILIYICGSDLESNGQTSSSSASGYATGDITEMLSVSGQPDDVNVVLQTGGAKCWKTTHGINKSYLERYHLSNQSLVRDSQLNKASMGSVNTLQSFITWGVQTYPADRISLILWDHGGAMHGVCSDENFSRDTLTNSEVKTAVANSFTSLGRSTSDKFEWIGYDACLMQVQDIAEFNSSYFNYMVASEESEAGDGWDYDTWLDDAYAKKSTTTILNAIVDGFIAATNQQYKENNWGASDQTLSWLDLSYMSAYKSAWESMASTMNSLINSYGKTNFQTLMKSCKYYGSDEDCEGYSYFGTFDAKDVLNKFKNTNAFSSASTQITAAINAFSNLVKYSKKGSGAGNSYGLCCYFPMKDSSGYTCYTSTYYTSDETNFSNWLSIVTTYGEG